MSEFFQLLTKNIPHRLSLFCLFYVSINVASVSAASQELKYTYDALGRLTFVEDDVNGNRDYDFDKAGNRTEVSVGNATDEPVYTGPTYCRSVISSPAYPCSSSRNWSYGEYQYCTSMERSYSCVW